MWWAWFLKCSERPPLSEICASELRHTQLGHIFSERSWRAESETWKHLASLATTWNLGWFVQIPWSLPQTARLPIWFAHCEPTQFKSNEDMLRFAKILLWPGLFCLPVDWTSHGMQNHQLGMFLFSLAWPFFHISVTLAWCSGRGNKWSNNWFTPHSASLSSVRHFGANSRSASDSQIQKPLTTHVF